MKDERTRNWTFIVYDESAPSNWRDIIDEEHIQWVESPLHDKDLDPTGEQKKPHRHILVMYNGVKSFSQIKELTDKLNAPIPQKCNNAKGLVRYMAHLDNPDKFQYDKIDIIGHGGIDVGEFFKASATDRYLLIREMIQFVRENDITEYVELMDYASENKYDWFCLLCDSSTVVINTYIQSNRYKKQTQQKSKAVDVSPVTGEVLHYNETFDNKLASNDICNACKECIYADYYDGCVYGSFPIHSFDNVPKNCKNYDKFKKGAI